jgi:hypothetical protein
MRPTQNRTKALNRIALFHGKADFIQNIDGLATIPLCMREFSTRFVEFFVQAGRAAKAQAAKQSRPWKLTAIPSRRV